MNKNFVLFLLMIVMLIGVYNSMSGNGFLNANNSSRSSYHEALQLEHQGEYKNAYYAFKKVSSFYAAYDAVLYHQSDCAAHIADEKTAIKKLETLISKCPNSKLLPAAYYKLGQAYVRTNQPRRAEKIFKKLAKKYPDSEYKIASYYYVGKIKKKDNPAYAISLWKKYLELAPSGRFGVECADELKKTGASLSNSDRINIGIAYYFAGQNSNAINQLQNLPTNKSWYYLAKSYNAKHQNDKALAVIKKGLMYYSKNFPMDNLQEMVRLYARMTPKPKLETWQELDLITRNSPVHDYVLYNLAKVSPRNKANFMYNQILNCHPNGELASEAMWELFWEAYKSHNYGQALRMAKMHEQRFDNADSSAKILFWKGKVLEKRGKKHEAIKSYDKVLKNYNTSYYAFRANGRKRALSYRRDTMWLTHQSNRLNDTFYSIKIPYSKLEICRKYGESCWELLKIGDYELISDYGIDDNILSSWINYQKGMSSKSCLQARNILEKQFPQPDINDDVCKLAFPLHYTEEINHIAHKNRIDSAIVISLLKEESCFNPKAVSVSNACGLMQLLPSTASYIAGKRGLTYTGRSMLFNPEKNIRFGSNYLKYLYDNTGNMLFAVASYNAGPGAVQKWLNERTSSDLDEFVEDIPYQETQDYVKKVYRSYWCYSRLY